MAGYIKQRSKDGECPACQESLPCGSCPGVSVTANGIELPAELFYKATVDGMECCCIGDFDLFPYEYSGSQFFPGPCLPAYVHSRSPVVWTFDEPYSLFVVDGDPRFDSAIEIDGTQVLNSDSTGCCDDIALGGTVLPLTTSFPIAGQILTLRLLDYCKVVSGCGNFNSFPNGGSNKGRFCVCKVPPP